MGALLSRFDRETYYANYEKAFAKLEKEKEAIGTRTGARVERKRTITRDMLYAGAALTAVAALYASWVFRQDSSMYTTRGRAIRLSLFLLIPLFLSLWHRLLLFCAELLDNWDARKLEKCRKSMDEMLKDLKDRNRYGRIQKLLQKYDPEEREKTALLERLKTEPAATTPPKEEERSMQRKQSIGSSFILGAGKVIDTLANGIIGDQPELLDEVEKLRSMMQALQEKNEVLLRENQRLRESLGQISDPPRQDSVESSTLSHKDNNMSPTKES